jgi:DNA recombination protein RmuC
MDAVILVVMALAMIAALAVGYLLGAKPIKQLRQDSEAGMQEREQLRGEVDRWKNEFNKAIRDLAIECEKTKRLGVIEDELRAERDRGTALGNEVAAFRRGEQERQRAHEAQLAQLKDLEAKLEARFGELAGKAVEGAHDSFLKRAEERFGHAGQQNVDKLKSLLQPVEATLKRYEEGLKEVEKDRANSYGELRQAVAQLTQGNESVRKETQRLANVMRSSPKARGRWGEEQLRTILESAGLAENVDFSLQSTVSDGERQLRPDCVISLPGDRCIVVDVKCPLVAFEQAFDEEDETRRGELLLQHAAAMKSYANDLGRKGYWRQFDVSPDFVIMFIPGEHFLAAAAERAPDLIETAFRNGVIIASTINMLALAKIMAGMWRQESLAAQAQEVGEAGKRLYGSLAVMTEHMATLGDRLERAGKDFNKMIGSLERNVIPQARRFEELKIDLGGKELASLSAIDVAARPITKLPAPEVSEAAE